MFAQRLRQLVRHARPAPRRREDRPPSRYRPSLEGLETRLAPAGDFGFALDLGGAGGFTHGSAVVTDGASNVYVTGEFSGTVNFNPGPGAATNLTAAGNADVFVAKYTVAGALVWARQFTAQPQHSANGDGIAVDGAGNVLVSGRFAGTTGFDPGVSAHSLTSKSNDFGDGFVAKLDSGGHYVWARQFAASDSSGGSDANAVAVDGAGNVYTGGTFFGTVDLDPGPGTHNVTGVGSSNLFVAKLDSGGNFVWAGPFGHTTRGDGGAVNALAVDGAGNVYTTGYFYGTVNFDPVGGASSANLTEAGTGSDIFVSKLDTAGHSVWAKQFAETGTNFGHGQGIAVDGAGNVYTTGSFQGTADFDPGPGTANLVTANRPPNDPQMNFVASAIFVSKLNSAGNYVWAKQFAGGGSDVGNGVAVNASGDVYVAGSFSNTAAFGATSYTAAGLADSFVERLDSGGNLVWVRRFTNAGGSNATDVVTALAVNNTGNVYTTGFFSGTVNFDPGTGTHNLTSKGSSDAFVSQLLDTPSQRPAPRAVFVNAAWANVPPGTDPDGSGPATAMGYDAFATPQPAIDAVAPGGTVNLAAGTYSGGLNLNKSLILQGAGSGTTTLQGPGSGTGLAVTGQGDVVNGLTVKGFLVGVSAGSTTIYLALTDVRLSGNTGVGGLVSGVRTVLVGGGGGDDTFYVTPGRLAHQGDNPVFFSGVQFLTVDGGGGSNNRLVVYLNDISTADKVWLTGNGIERDRNPFLLFYRSSGGTFGGGVAVVLGDGPETVIVQGQLAGAPTTVYAEGGADTFYVAVTASSGYSNLTLDGGAGFDALAVFDQSGGATRQNVVTVIGEGRVQITYPGGVSEQVLYQNMEEILGVM